MGIVGGFDLHRRQITFDVLDTDSGEVSRGVIRPAIRLELRRWLGQFEGREAAFVVEDDGLAVRGRGTAAGGDGGASG